MDEYRCSLCGQVIDGTQGLCPASESGGHVVGKPLSAEVGFQTNIAGKKGPNVRGKPPITFKTGDDLHRDTGEWRELERRVDREENLYRERIVDPKTGEVIKDVCEPLSEHQGHGTAKKKPSAPGDDEEAAP